MSIFTWEASADKPILYLVNTNYHGDHTFGNYTFPAQCRFQCVEDIAEIPLAGVVERKKSG